MKWNNSLKIKHQKIDTKNKILLVKYKIKINI